mgnify:CR=1 FL=1
MTTDDGPSSETEYDSILNKLDALLHKHQGKPQSPAGREVESPLKDAGTALDPEARKALVQALEARLFGL